MGNAGTRSRRSSRRQSARNAGSAGPMASSVRPCARPDAAMAASAFVTSSGRTWTRSKPPCAKFSRKYRPRTRPARTAAGSMTVDIWKRQYRRGRRASGGPSPLHVEDKPPPPCLVTKMGRKRAPVEHKLGDMADPGERMLLEHGAARQLGLEGAQAEDPVDERRLGGHRRLDDSQSLGELIAGHVGGRPAVEHEIDLADRIDGAGRPDAHVAADQGRGPLAREARHERPG